MKKYLILIVIVSSIEGITSAQKINAKSVPMAVKSSFAKMYPTATKITWEKEKANFEANWGGKSGEDISVEFSPEGTFIEQVNAIKIADLPIEVGAYVKEHYKGTKITEAGKVTDSKGAKMYEAEVGGKDLIFDEKGGFLKID